MSATKGSVVFRASVDAHPTATQVSVLAATVMVLLAAGTIVAASAGAGPVLVVVLALAALAVRPCAVAYHRRRALR